MELHANLSNEVSSERHIEADIGGNRRLLVMSGIAILDWRLDTGDPQSRSVRVWLNEYARELEHATPFVGLASIANGESEFDFSVIEPSVGVDPNSGELYLDVVTVVFGEWSAFYRFSYQVVALVAHVGTTIEGTITWPQSLMTPPSTDPATVAPDLIVVANRHELSSGDGPWAIAEHLTPLVPGTLESLTIQDDTCQAHYRIENPPMAVPLKVTVSVQPGFAQSPGAPVLAARISGPDVFTLSPYETSETVDFAISAIFVR
jgi:hypothetical protein